MLAVGPSLLWIAAAFQIFDGIQTVSTGALRGLGETRVPMIANLVGYWVMGLPLGFTLCFVLKLGHLRDVDRADAVAGCDCDSASMAMEPDSVRVALAPSKYRIRRSQDLAGSQEMNSL